jgi:hypothetical protein
MEIQLERMPQISIDKFFLNSPWCKDIKSAAKMACIASINLGELTFEVEHWLLWELLLIRN